jgi:hypothetical protein
MTTTKNKYDSLLEKLFKVKVDFEKAKVDLTQLKQSHEKVLADNQVYENKMIELREKLHLYQKQEAEKIKNLEHELSELKKYYQRNLQLIQELKSKENK